MSRPAAADTASRRDGHWHCCINLYAHTTPPSAQIAEWYVHKELCSSKTRRRRMVPGQDRSHLSSTGKNLCSPGPMECTRLLTSSFSLHRFVVSRIQGWLIFAPSSTVSSQSNGPAHQSRAGPSCDGYSLGTMTGPTLPGGLGATSHDLSGDREISTREHYMAFAKTRKR